MALAFAVPQPVQAASSKGVQSGSATIAAAGTTVSVTLAVPVDPARSFLVFGVAEAENQPQFGQVTGRLSGPTTVDFVRNAASAAITIKWYVAEFAGGVSVQRGTTIVPNATPLNVAITSVNTTKAFPIVTVLSGGAGFDRNDYVLAKITGPTTLQLSHGDSGASATVDWQVVQYQDASVQSGDLTFNPADLSKPATLGTPINPARSWLMFSYECRPIPLGSCGSSSDIGTRSYRGVITDGTTLTFDRNNAGLAGPPAETYNLTWYLVEFTDGTAVQSASEPFGPAETQRDVALALPAPLGLSLAAASGFMRGGRTSYASDDVPGVAWFTLDLTSPVNLRLTRGSTNAPGPGPAAGADLGWSVVTFTSCCGLGTTEGATSLTINTPSEQMVWDSTLGAGGGLRQFFVKDEANPTVSRAANNGVYNLWSTQLNDGAWHFEKDAAGKLVLLEATSTRVRLKQKHDYTTSIHLDRELTVYGYPRVAIRESLVLDSAQSIRGAQGIHAKGETTCPGNTFYCKGRPDPFQVSPPPPGLVFLVADNASAYSDMLAIPYTSPFFGRSAVLGDDNWQALEENTPPENTFFSRVHESNLIATAAGTHTRFYEFYPRLVGLTSTGAEWQPYANDYRTPDSLAITIGGPWLDASELTGGGDDFNEAEAGYSLTLDPTLGLQFDIDGTVPNPRYRPFFKIRQWRSLAGPATVTLEGATLTRDLDYHSDVKPLARAYFAQTLSWHSTVENTNALGVNLDVGTTGGSGASTTFVPARYGSGALFDASGDYVSAGSSGSLDFGDAGGAVEFWYQPTYAHTDGVRHMLWSNQSVDDCFIFEKTTGNALVFTIIVDANVGSNCTIGGTPYSATVAFGAYSWSPGQWVHLKTAWRNAGLNRLEIFVDGVKLGNSGAFNPIGLTHGVTNFGGCPATCPGAGTPFASGIIDEPYIYTSNAVSQDRIGYAGLTADLSEKLADPSKNYLLSLFSTGTGVRRGQYLHFGSDSKFRGLNVALAVLGVGTGLDVVWDFWNGTAWADLESGFGFTDLTNHFTRTGNVYWTGDPAGWSPYSVDGGPDLYYVRAHLSLGSYSATPIEGVITTDILLLQYCKDITAAARTFQIPAPVPTAVTLQAFWASPSDGAVDLSWTTASELSNLGFHLHRSPSAEGPWTRITSSLIPGLGGSATGASYAWRDSGLANGTTYHYLLEDVETTGKSERHGPASATPQASGGSGGSGDGSGGSGGSGDGSGGSGGAGDSGSEGSGRITWGDPSGASLRVVERRASHVVLELLTPGFTARTQSDGTVRISIPRFEDTALPGTLDVPVRRALVEAVAGRRARLASVDPVDIVSFDSLRFAAASTRDLVVREDGTLRTGASPRRLLESSRRSGLTPRVWARLLGSLFQGETKKARIELSPLRHDPLSGRTVLARRLTVRVEFTGTETGERSLGGSRGRRSPVPPLRRNGVLAQLVAREPGLYRVRFEDLFAPGQRGLPARTLRLSRRGVPVPYHLEPERSLFAQGSSLFFVNEGPDPDPRGESVFELSLGLTASFMESVSGAPSGPSTTEHLYTLKLEQNKFYQSALLQAPDLWLWDLMVSPVTKSYPFTVEALSPSSTSGHLKVALQGASDFEQMDHHLRLSVNGVPVAETTWDGKTEQVVDADLTPGILVEGANTLAIENVGDAGAAYSMVFLNRFEVSYPRLLAATSGRLEGRFEESGRAEVTGLLRTSFVVDTTALPVWIEALEPMVSGLAFRAETGHRYLAVSEAGLRVPEVRKVVATRLRNTSNRADWVLIAPREFLSAAAPLVELRRRQGLLPLAVALEDVFAEFGHGEARAQAIRDFLAFAFHNWKTKPRYTVLLGDTTYDPRNYLGTGVKDRVPSPLLQTSYLWTVSDPSLAAVNGDDLLPDLAIGRLSAGTLAEAQRLVNKLVAFEQAGRTFDGKAILVADNADLAGNFEQNQDEIASSVLQGRETEKLYLRDLGASLRPEILSAFDNGPGIVSYVGHGATAVWASENVFNNLDVASLQPQAQQPLLLTLNCLNGFFHFPPLDSLAEALVKAEGKGALAAFSPSGLSVNDAAHLYHKALLTQIESQAHVRLGDAVLAAQQDYANQGAMPELLSIYHLLGDPGMRIQ